MRDGGGEYEDIRSCLMPFKDAQVKFRGHVEPTLSALVSFPNRRMIELLKASAPFSIPSHGLRLSKR